LSDPPQIRVGILNQLTTSALSDIVGRFAEAMIGIGVGIDKDKIMQDLQDHFASR
jgi:hypothetical protein